MKRWDVAAPSPEDRARERATATVFDSTLDSAVADPVGKRWRTAGCHALAYRRIGTTAHPHQKLFSRTGKKAERIAKKKLSFFLSFSLFFRSRQLFGDLKRFIKNKVKEKRGGLAHLGDEFALFVEAQVALPAGREDPHFSVKTSRNQANFSCKRKERKKNGLRLNRKLIKI